MNNKNEMTRKILEKLKNTKLIDFEFYDKLIKEYGKVLVFDTVKSLLLDLNNNETSRNKFIKKYFIILISMEIDGKTLNSNDCDKLVQNYGTENVFEYFSELLVETKDKEALLCKYKAVFNMFFIFKTTFIIYYPFFNYIIAHNYILVK